MQGLQCRTLARDLMSGKFGPASTKYHRPIVRSTRLLNTIDQSSKVPPRYQFESIKYFFPYILCKISKHVFQSKRKTAFTHDWIWSFREKKLSGGRESGRSSLEGGKWGRWRQTQPMHSRPALSGSLTAMQYSSSLLKSFRENSGKCFLFAMDFMAFTFGQLSTAMRSEKPFILRTKKDYFQNPHHLPRERLLYAWYKASVWYLALSCARFWPEEKGRFD